MRLPKNSGSLVLNSLNKELIVQVSDTTMTMLKEDYMLVPKNLTPTPLLGERELGEYNF